ncbi:MAG: translation elongation factor Ts [Candidatus Komeilibacteria bacterium]|nr:translation elongation factor Ts [Candidatus Komeilibacteria bacterium]
MISAEVIKKLRELTGAGMADVKTALDEAKGDEAKAVEILRKAGQKVAAKKADRATNEGLVESYIHLGGKVGALVSVACETDFVARTDDFKNFVHEIALQIAAASPMYLSPEQVPAEVIAKEKEIYAEQLKKEGKPQAMLEKIMEGKIQKYYSEVCLLKQLYIKDDKLTIEGLVEQNIAKLGENIQIKDFSRLSL